MEPLEFKRSAHSIYLGESLEQAKAYISWEVLEDNLININHTVVDKSLGGQGIGTKLVHEAAKMAREENLKVEASCSFAKKVLGESDAYQDIYRG